MPTLSIVIVNYETSAMVSRCIASIRDQNVAAEVVVVDNPSPAADGANLEGVNVRIIRNAENIGYGRACNIGAAATQGSHVCILNPDIVVPDGTLDRWLAICAREVSSGRRVGVLAPRLITDNGSVQRSAYEFPSPLNYWLYHSLLAGFLKWLRKRVRLREVSESRGIRNVGWVMGAALLVPRSVWNEVEGFSSDYFLYAEDMDLCFRVRVAGYEVLYAPEIHLVHSLGESAPEQRDIAAVRLFTSLRTFLRLRYPPARSRAMALCIVADMLMRLTVFVPLVALMPGRTLYRKRVAGYWRVLRLFLGPGNL